MEVMHSFCAAKYQGTSTTGIQRNISLTNDH